MWAYLLKSSICLLVFLIFYGLLLERTSLHRFNRFFLLGAVLLSLCIPMITFKEQLPLLSQDNPAVTTVLSQTWTPTTSVPGWKQQLPNLLWILYLVGVLLFSLKFLWNLGKMLHTIKRGHKHPFGKVTHVLLPQEVAPHTFFRYIFFNQQRYRSKTIPKEIFWHEEAHALQKHSFDILFMELLQLLFWFHPLVYITKRLVRLNHEFLADRAVLDKGAGTSVYQEILLAFASRAQDPPLANAITYSSIKKRFTVMKTEHHKKTSWLRTLLLLPLLAILLYGFAKREFVQETTPKALVAEYNSLAKKYNDQDPEHIHILKQEVDRLHYLYSIMTDEQKETAEPFPEFPPVPEPPAPPSINVELAITPPAPPAPDPEVTIDLETEPSVPAPPAPVAPQENLEENVYRFVGPMIPPKPNSDPIEYIKEMAEKGAIFYIGPHKYSLEEAIELLKKSKTEVSIDVSKYPMVRLGGC